jgi:hypothetical protein
MMFILLLVRLYVSALPVEADLSHSCLAQQLYRLIGQLM